MKKTLLDNNFRFDYLDKGQIAESDGFKYYAQLMARLSAVSEAAWKWGIWVGGFLKGFWVLMQVGEWESVP